MSPLLIHSYSGRLGGSERILLDLLHRSREPIVLACPGGPLADGAAASDIPVIRLREGQLEARGAFDAALAAAAIARHGRAIADLVRDIEPNLVVSWGMRSAMASVAALRGPAATRRRNPIPLVAEHVDLLPKGKQGRLARAALLRCDRVVCLSEAIAADLLPEWRTHPAIRVVHPGVNAPTQAPPSPTVLAPSALMLAAIEPWKGHDIALEAVARVPGLKLVVAGSPLSHRGEIFEAALRERAGQPDLRGRVEFAGTVDPHDALAEATFLLHPAPAEPFGMAMAEALAAGRPVVATRAAGALEIVTEDCGRFATADDPRSFATAITEVVASTETTARLGENGRVRALELFDPEKQFMKWHETAVGFSHRVDAGQPLPTAGADVSIVTVIHNSAPDLSRLLASVTRHLPAAEVIVVDSGSSDAGPAIASQWEGRAKVLSLNGNEGFGAGCVIGVEAAERPVTALINPDVELIDSSLDQLIRVLSDPDGASRLISPALLHPDGSRQDAVHPIPADVGDILRAAGPASLLPPPAARLAEPHRSKEPTRVGWAVAACLLGRTETLRALGPFDKAVHLYAEDLDLCLRAAEAGIETWYYPTSRVIHREAHASKQVYGGEPSELLAERRRTVVGERLGQSRMHRDDRVQMATHINRLALKTILRRDTSLERRRIAALRAARRRA